MNWKQLLAVYGLAGIAASFGLVISFSIFLTRYSDSSGTALSLIFVGVLTYLCLLAYAYALLIRKYRARFHI